MSTKVEQTLRVPRPKAPPPAHLAKSREAAKPSLQRTDLHVPTQYDDDDRVTLPEDADVTTTLSVEEWEGIDPGPGIDDVPFGSNCGSCIKFLAINDVRRDDPAYMTKYLTYINQQCPACLPEVALAKERARARNHKPTLADVVRKADSPACSKFVYNHERASTDLVEVMNRISRLHPGEFNVVASSMDDLKRIKSVEEKFGYRMGDSVPVQVRGRRMDGIVVGFDVPQRKLHLEVVLDGRKHRTSLKIQEATLLD